MKGGAHVGGECDFGTEEGSPIAAPAIDIPRYPAPFYAWVVVLLLLAAYTVAMVDRQILALLVQPIRSDLRISDTEISLLNGFAFVIFYCLLGLAFGRAADKANRRNIIVVGMAAWCVATMLCGLAQSFGQLFLARMFVGVGEAALLPSAYSMIADYFPPHQRGRATAVYSTGSLVGAGLAMVCGAAAIAATMGMPEVSMAPFGRLRSWQAAFIIVGAPGLIVAALIALVREPERHQQPRVITPVGAVTFLSRNAAPLGLTLFSFSLNALDNCALLSWTPTLFIRNFGWTADQIGKVYGMILLGPGTIGAICAGWLTDRRAARGERNSAVILARSVMIGLTPCIGWVGVSGSPAGSLVALAVSTFLLAIMVGLAPICIYEMTPNAYRGQIIALYQLTATLVGLAIGPTLIAFINDHVFGDDRKLGTAMAIVQTIATMLAVGALTLLRRYRPASAVPLS